MSRKQTSDGQYEKPSRHKQWQERSERPIAARAMNKHEIEDHRINLVDSYQCEDSDITYKFQKIMDINDEDRDDCIWLKYNMKCVVHGKPTVREIFTIKLPIPDEIRKTAEDLRRQQASRNPSQKKPIRLLPAPTQPVMEKLQPTYETPTQRPKLRKPART